MDDFEKFLESISLDSSSFTNQLLSLAAIYNILLAAITGFLILFLYYKITLKSERDYCLIQVLPVLTVLMTVIMKMQGGRAVIFFGIFGVLSIVRFRSSLTDPKGLTFILFSIIMGVLIGVGNYILVGISFIVITIIIIILINIFKTHNKIVVEIKGNISITELHSKVEDSLKKLNFNYQLVHISSKYEKNKNNQLEEIQRVEYELFYKDYNEILKRYEIFFNLMKENNFEIDFKRRND